jgi:long-chain acyl-CoA synthetase
MDMFTGLDKVSDSRPAVGDVPSAGPVYRLKGFGKGFPEPNVATLYENFERSVEKFPECDCLGERNFKTGTGKFEFLTYKQVHTKVAHVAAGLSSLGIQTKQRVGVFGINCPEYMIAMQACNRMTYECVPVYDTLGENAIEYILNHSETSALFASASKLPPLVKALDKCKQHLKVIVYWGDADAELVQTAKDKGFTMVAFEDLIVTGQGKPVDPIPPFPDDLSTIMYTSGTTGDPKGVMLKHSALVTALGTSETFMKSHNLSMGPGDYILSYLPLAHIFARVTEEGWLNFGGGIGYFQGDPLKLVDDIQELKPSVLFGVPRVFDRIYTRITTGLNTVSFLKRFLFTWGMRRKLYFLRKGAKQGKASPIFDAIIFSKVAARFGGKLKLIVSGGAPLSMHVEEFLRTIMCCPVMQGYGLTETCAASFGCAPDNWDHVGTVGPPFPCTEFRLESVPEMNYDANAEIPKGEVLIRGPGGFSGYYKAQDKTDEVLEADGWFHSGDIAMLMPDGALKIIDRKKNIFKLSQGEYIAVEKLENTYSKAPVVEQVWVYGNSFKSCLVAVVVPVEDSIKRWAASNGVNGDFAAICASDKAKEYVLGELKAMAKEDKLKGFEAIRAVHLDSVAFSVEENLLTPTFKAKRPQLQAKYQTLIDAMYIALKE